MSLNRLIRLAQQTGDKLIVHDPIDGNDVVIMNVDQYEVLLSDTSYEYEHDEVFDGFEPDVRELSSEELLDDINRKIAIWRNNQEADVVADRYDVLASDAGEDAVVDPFMDMDLDVRPWHSASDVISSEFAMPEDVVEPATNKKASEQPIRVEPITPSLDSDSMPKWEEEPLPESDEPVFYEEPV